MNKLSQSTLQQWYAQVKPCLYLSTVQRTTKEYIYIFNPPYSIFHHICNTHISHNIYVGSSSPALHWFFNTNFYLGQH